MAYAVWQYWQASQDEKFLLEAGAEILLETARFWASRACLEADGAYHIRQVIGPDEYHEAVDDNAFTNGMARWNFEQAAETVRLLQVQWPSQWAALAHRLALAEEEVRAWLDIAWHLYLGLAPGSEVIEQFTGYFDLEAIDLGQYDDREVPMDVILGRARTQG